MLHPSPLERNNLTSNLIELSRIQPGDKISVTSGRFKVQHKGFFSQSVARTFSKNSAAAYHLPVYRLFQTAVVDQLWNRHPIPWPQINDAFQGLKNLKQTYKLELEEAKTKNISQDELQKKEIKVARLQRLIDEIEIFIVCCADNTPETQLMALPRGYGRSPIFRMSNFAKLRLINSRRYAADAGYEDRKLPFDKTTKHSPNIAPQYVHKPIFQNDIKYKLTEVKISRQFIKDALQRGLDLKVNNFLPFNKWAHEDSTLLYYLNNLHGDAAMLSEISLWCNQATLGGAANSFTMEDINGGSGNLYVGEDGRRIHLSPGSPTIECNLSDIKFVRKVGPDLKLYDEVSQVTIHTHIELNLETFNHGRTFHVRGDKNIWDPEVKYVFGSRSPMEQFQLDLDFVIRKTGPNSFGYDIVNDRFYFDTKPNSANSGNPDWLYAEDNVG